MVQITLKKHSSLPSGYPTTWIIWSPAIWQLSNGGLNSTSTIGQNATDSATTQSATLIQKYPEIVGEMKSWAISENRWLKRASAVSLIVPAKKGLFLQDALEICDLLLTDGDDMVQKGYGWLLKEESRKHQKKVFNYVIMNRKIMPRTALRYAIELMPKELKAEAMKKE